MCAARSKRSIEPKVSEELVHVAEVPNPIITCGRRAVIKTAASKSEESIVEKPAAMKVPAVEEQAARVPWTKTTIGSW
jgi:hypothetical protein